MTPVTLVGKGPLYNKCHMGPQRKEAGKTGSGRQACALGETHLWAVRRGDRDAPAWEPVRGTRGLLGGTKGSLLQEAPFMAFQ